MATDTGHGLSGLHRGKTLHASHGQVVLIQGHVEHGPVGGQFEVGRSICFDGRVAENPLVVRAIEVHGRGLVRVDRRHRAATRRFCRERPNELWQMDFKGWIHLDNGKRCYPLTVLDDYSRYNLILEACRAETEVVVKDRRFQILLPRFLAGFINTHDVFHEFPLFIVGIVTPRRSSTLSTTLRTSARHHFPLGLLTAQLHLPFFDCEIISSMMEERPLWRASFRIASLVWLKQ